MTQVAFRGRKSDPPSVSWHGRGTSMGKSCPHWQCDGAQRSKSLGSKPAWASGPVVVIPVIALAVSVALCPPGEATEAAAGSRRAAESWLEGAQGLGFGGSFTPPRPGSGFQTGRRPHVAVRVCVCIHTRMSGGRRGERAHASLHLLPASRGARRAARVAGNGRCWPRGGRHFFASPCVLSSPNPRAPAPPLSP